MRQLFIVIVALLFTAGVARAEVLSITSHKTNKTHKFDVEIADDDAERAKGLMFREKLDEDKGMLFQFPEELEAGFWMKNTLIPLDILFIDSNGIIKRIHENAVPHDLTPLFSDFPAKAALEIKGGMVKKLNISAGDKVSHKFFSKALAKKPAKE